MTDEATTLIEAAENARARFVEALAAAGLDEERLTATATRLKSSLPAGVVRRAEEAARQLANAPADEPTRQRPGTSLLPRAMGLRA